MSDPNALGRLAPVMSFKIKSRGGPVLLRFFTWDESIRTFVPWGSASDFVATVDTPGIITQGGGQKGHQGKGTFFPKEDKVVPPVDKRRFSKTFNTIADNLIQGPGATGVTGTPRPDVRPDPPVVSVDPKTLSLAYDGLTEVPDDDPTGVGGTSLQESGIFQVPPDSPWYEPWGWKIWYTGHKLDSATRPNPDPFAGNMGITDEGPWIGNWWRWGDESQTGVPRPHELYAGFQIPGFSHPWFLYPEGQTHHGIPASYWDVAGSLTYRYHGHNQPQQSLNWAWGAGMYFQITNDDTAGGQSNPWGQSLGPHHIIPYVEVATFWDGWSFGGAAADTVYEVTWQIDYKGGSRIGFAVNL